MLNKSLIAGAVLAVSLFATAGGAMAAFPAWATGSVNVRTEPTTAYDNVVDSLYKGEKVWVEDCDYGWCELSNGYYVAASYLKTKNHKPQYDYEDHYDHHDYNDVDVEIEYEIGGFEFELEF